jgi:hypothetical protein
MEKRVRKRPRPESFNNATTAKGDRHQPEDDREAKLSAGKTLPAVDGSDSEDDELKKTGRSVCQTACVFLALSLRMRRSRHSKSLCD